MILLTSLLLAGCGFTSVNEPPRAQPLPPDQLIVAQGLTAAAAEAKLAEPLEASPARRANPLAPGDFTACVRSARVPQSARAVFLTDNKLVSSRLALAPDLGSCETFQPFVRFVPLKPKPAS